MSRQDLDQVRKLDQICEIAARLNEDAAVLRNLGLHDTAHLLEGAEADLDSRVYANGHHRTNGAGAAPRNGKGREVSTH